MEFIDERKKIIQERIKQEEEIELVQLSGIRHKVWEFLIKEKHFKLAEIEITPEFKINLKDKEINVHTDFLINLNSLSFMAIQCATGALESWERYITSFASVIKDYMIPFAMVTDGESARIIDVIKGKVIVKSLNELFNHEEALDIMKDFKKIPCPVNRLEKGKRIVYAFEGIKCPASIE